MNIRPLVSASIVLFNHNFDSISRLLNNLANFSINIYIIDNSFSSNLKTSISAYNVIFIHNPSNPGFGATHNMAIDLAIKANSQYHFIINPDIYFEYDVINPMLDYIQSHQDVGMMMPEILNIDGSIQYLPKMLPNPFWIVRRKLSKAKRLNQNFLDLYELRQMKRDKIYNAPILSGCFTLLNLEAVKKVGAYDNRFFMYFEDFDLSRRMHQKYKTIYFPKVSVYHGYQGGANKNFKLLVIFLKSMIVYFNKWSWFFDEERKRINKKVLDL